MIVTNSDISTVTVDSNSSLFNSKDIQMIVEWTVVGTVVGMLVNKLFGLKS